MDTEEQNNIENTSQCTFDIGRGCEFCPGESGETEARVCGGCFKLHVTDWLKDYPDNLPDDIFEVRFKNTRRGYYQNVNNLPLAEGDIVAVEASPGHDIGIVSLTGDIVARQMRRMGFNSQNGEFKKIYRKAKPYDIEKWQEAIALEHDTMIRSRQIAAEMNLNMKIGDVEYQGDKIKAIFYYIADERVDFRELIKVFAEVFHIRVEMKQIGARQEAGRIGGVGACGRELCCASWMSGFMSVTTGAARAQEISLNPQKLAGQCSKLKCCLIYEYDDYMDARKEFPRVAEPLQTLDGDYYFVKNDILARTMSFSTAPGSMAGLVSLPLARVAEIMKLNSKGVKPEKIDVEQNLARREVDPGFINVIGEESITRFDNTRKNKKKSKRQDGNKSGGASGTESDATGETISKEDSRKRKQPRDDAEQRRSNQPRQDDGQRRANGQRQASQSRQGNGQRQENQSNQSRMEGRRRQEKQQRKEDQQRKGDQQRKEGQQLQDNQPRNNPSGKEQQQPPVSQPRGERRQRQGNQARQENDTRQEDPSGNSQLKKEQRQGNQSNKNNQPQKERPPRQENQSVKESRLVKENPSRKIRDPRSENQPRKEERAREEHA